MCVSAPNCIEIGRYLTQLTYGNFMIFKITAVRHLEFLKKNKIFVIRSNDSETNLTICYMSQMYRYIFVTPKDILAQNTSFEQFCVYNFC